MVLSKKKFDATAGSVKVVSITVSNLEARANYNHTPEEVFTSSSQDTDGLEEDSSRYSVREGLESNNEGETMRNGAAAQNSSFKAAASRSR
jgi:hypothetical protein